MKQTPLYILGLYVLLGSKAENTGSWTLRRSKTRAPKSHLKEISKGFCLRLDTLGGTSQAVLIHAPGSPPPGPFAGGSPFVDLTFRSLHNSLKGLPFEHFGYMLGPKVLKREDLGAHLEVFWGMGCECENHRFTKGKLRFGRSGGVPESRIFWGFRESHQKRSLGRYFCRFL